jgi:hypothetical protein
VYVQAHYPLFKDAVKVTCQVNEGDVLFLPSYWWHEVTSTPDPKSGLQIGLNHWFHPYFIQANTMDHFARNSLYRHLWADQEQPNVKVREASKGSIALNTQDKLVSESRWWAPQAKREDVTAAAIAPGAKASGSVDGFSYKAEGYISKGKSAHHDCFRIFALASECLL